MGVHLAAIPVNASFGGTVLDCRSMVFPQGQKRYQISSTWLCLPCCADRDDRSARQDLLCCAGISHVARRGSGLEPIEALRLWQEMDQASNRTSLNCGSSNCSAAGYAHSAGGIGDKILPLLGCESRKGREYAAGRSAAIFR